MHSWTTQKTTKSWVVDTAVGVVVGSVAAVNFMIYVGIEGGYEAIIVEVFRQNTLVGVVTMKLLIGCPVFGGGRHSTSTPPA